MTALDALTTPTRPEPKRDRYGRPLVKLPGAANHQPLTRVTTIAETLSDRFALEQWSKRNVVLGIARRPDLYARACSVSPDERDALNEIVEAAEEAAGASTGATMGTALHRFTERIDAGEDIPVPAPWDADVAAYRAALAAHHIEIDPEHLERFVVNAAMGAAGTADRFVRWQGRLVVADLKTGKHIDLAKIAIQLSLYSHAETFYDPATDTHTAMPDELDPTVGLVFHLPAGQARCEIYTVDLVEGYRWAQVAVDVRGWRKTSPGQLLEVPAGIADAPATTQPQGEPWEAEVDAWLRSRLAWLKTNHPAALQRLAGVWPEGVPTFRSEHRHTASELDRIATLLREVEAAERVPFPDDPCPPLRAGLIVRLVALPADLLAEVTTQAKADGVPHLRGGEITVGHLRRVDELLAPAELEAERRALVASERLTMAGLTVDQAAGVIDGLDLDRLTATQLDLLTALCSASPALVTDDTGLSVDPDALAELCDTHGKAVVRDTAKALADQHGRAKPRAATDLSSDPLLFALTRAHLTQQNNTNITKENQS